MRIKWNNVEDILPKDDSPVLVWLEDLENLNWSGYRIGSYINENWYLDGGRKLHEVVVHWYEFPKLK